MLGSIGIMEKNMCLATLICVIECDMFFRRVASSSPNLVETLLCFRCGRGLPGIHTQKCETLSPVRPTLLLLRRAA